jgi:hypothetical protein
MSVSLSTISGAQATPSRSPAMPRAQTMVWPIKTREHVDLWLHGFAMLDDDTSAAIPSFRSGYRDDLTVLKNTANVLTQLDTHVDQLREQLHKNSALVDAQFVALYFSSLEEMQSTIQDFLAADGNSGKVSDQTDSKDRSPNTTALFAMLNHYFPTAADRSWLALFSSGLWDEETKFFHNYWMQQQRDRGTTIDSVQALWQNTVRPRLQNFLEYSRQRDGDFLLSMPLGGEGRTITTAIARPTVTVTFPERPGEAAEAIYGFAHEIIGSAAYAAILEHTTPAQRRSGMASQLASPASVRGGLLLLERFVPDLADGYARYYLQAAGKTPGTNPRTQLEALFPLPDAVLTAMARQMETVHGGT